MFFNNIRCFYLNQKHLKPDNIFVPIGTDTDLLKELLDVDVFTPFRGQKKQLVKLAQKNATIALEEKFALIERDEERTILAIEQLGKTLHIDTPHRIEAFDNSNKIIRAQ